MWCCVDLLRTDASEERVASIPSETPVITRSTRGHIPEDGILHSHRHEIAKSYNIFIVVWFSELHYSKPNTERDKFYELKK